LIGISSSKVQQIVSVAKELSVVAQIYLWMVYKQAFLLSVFTALLGTYFLYTPPSQDLLALTNDQLTTMMNIVQISLNNTYVEHLEATKEMEDSVQDYWFASFRPDVRKMKYKVWERKVRPVEAKLKKIQLEYDAINRVVQAKEGILSYKFAKELFALWKNAFRVAQQEGVFTLLTTEVHIGYYYPDLNLFTTRSQFNIFSAATTISSSNSTDQEKEDAGLGTLFLLIVTLLYMLIISNLWLAFFILPLLLSYASGGSLIMWMPVIAVLFVATTLSFWMVLGNIGFIVIGLVAWFINGKLKKQN